MFKSASYPYNTVRGKDFLVGNFGLRFHFNGQENTNEVFGNGNFIDFKYRGADPRLGKFFAVDPLTKKYPELSSYQFAGNTPIWARELEGLEPWFSSSGTSQMSLKQTNSPISLMNADKVAYGPYSLEYAASNNLTPTASASLGEFVIKPSGGYQEVIRE